jgi:hypothetical protein
MTKLVKEARTKITFQARDSMQEVVKPHLQIDMFQMALLDWPPKYTGQTG